MATNYASVDVKCPFYVNEDHTVIICQGVLAGSSAQKHVFKNKKLKESHKQSFCNDIRKYRNCAVCDLIESEIPDD